MDLSNKPWFLFPVASLALLLVLVPAGQASAAGKIFRSVDSHGAITFTDVPLKVGVRVHLGSGQDIKVSDDPRELQTGRCLNASNNVAQPCDVSDWRTDGMENLHRPAR